MTTQRLDRKVQLEKESEALGQRYDKLTDLGSCLLDLSEVLNECADKAHSWNHKTLGRLLDKTADFCEKQSDKVVKEASYIWESGSEIVFELEFHSALSELVDEGFINETDAGMLSINPAKAFSEYFQPEN